MSQHKKEQNDDGPLFSLLCAGALVAVIVVPGILVLGGAWLLSNFLNEDKNEK